jgi:hypothetical protein
LCSVRAHPNASSSGFERSSRSCSETPAGAGGAADAPAAKNAITCFELTVLPAPLSPEMMSVCERPVSTSCACASAATP